MVLTRRLTARSRVMRLTPRQALAGLRVLVACAATIFETHDGDAAASNARLIVVLGVLIGQQLIALIALGRDTNDATARRILWLNLGCIVAATAASGEMSTSLFALLPLLVIDATVTLRPASAYLYVTALSALFALARALGTPFGVDRWITRDWIVTLLAIMLFYILAGVSSTVVTTWRAERDHIEQLSLLDELSLLLADTRQLEDVLERFVELAPFAMRAQGCALAINEPGSGRRIWANLGADTSVLVDDALLAHDPSALLSEGGPRGVTRRALPGAPYAVVLTMPLAIDDRAVGLLSVARVTSDPFGPRDSRLFESLARHATQALRNARLYQLEAEAASQSRALEQFKSEMLASVSHEFRLPLSSITLAVESLLAQRGTAGDNEVELRLLRNIQRSAQRLGGFVQDVLDLARLDAHQIELRQQPCDLVALARVACEHISPQCEAKSQRLTFTALIDESLVVGDPQRLEQVLSNLLSNAHHYTPEGGEIELTVAPAESIKSVGPCGPPDACVMVAIGVRDTGPGISIEERARIFERFSRGEAGRRRSSGVGLGLHIARSVVELHGGCLWVEGNAAGGSTFWCTLPLARPDARIVSAPSGRALTGAPTPLPR